MPINAILFKTTKYHVGFGKSAQNIIIYEPSTEKFRILHGEDNSNFALGFAQSQARGSPQLVEEAFNELCSKYIIS